MDDEKSKPEGPNPIEKYKALREQVGVREASTLAFSTVAASASLVVLSLALNRSECLQYPNGLFLAGIVFAILGLAYREVTLFGEDFRDFENLSKDYPPHQPRYSQVARAFMIRMFLAIPLFAWLASACGISLFVATQIVELGVFALIILQGIEYAKRRELYFRYKNNYGKQT